ncbi:MAG TPA: hypothetical protein VGR71_08415 [Nitrospira sp.]|nr:hypothetical protein [Nitrospira sp.]
MNPIRRELLNGLIVLVVASLMSVAFAAFQVNLDLQLWALILTGIGIAVGGYLVLEFIRSANEREQATAESTRQREEEWLKRVGNPARLELGLSVGSAGAGLILDALRAMRPGTDFTVMVYFGPEGGGETWIADQARQQLFDQMIERVKSASIREYKRIVCFDRDVLVKDRDLSSGILRVGEGPGTIDRVVAKHLQLMMKTKGCSVYVAPVVLRGIAALYGTDKASLTVDTVDQETGARGVAGVMFFYDPPNGEIIEQLRQLERATERRMVAVHRIIFPEDTESTAKPATR